MAALPFGARRARAVVPDLGPLIVDPAGILDLPAGFTYRILERTGWTMDDGLRVPLYPDGMGVFPQPDGTIVLMRNHELTVGGGPYPPGPPPPAATTYRPEDGNVGGVTRLVVDATTLERVSSNLVLYGTRRNCAGGISPWGWLSCEESVEPGHGYVFLCQPDATAVEIPDRKVALGRFNHEAAAVDPISGIIYLTEDRGNGCLYRFVPTDPALPFDGTLEAAMVVGSPRLDLGTALLNDTFEITWLPLTGTDPVADDLRVRAAADGAATFRRGEGAFFVGGELFFAATNGGPVNRGQIFRLSKVPGGYDALTVVGESPNVAVLDSPDNICVAPWGDVIVAEDGGSVPHIRGVTPSGEIYDIARNGFGAGEFAGVCFSPAGDALFANLWSAGLTVVITGPFPTPPEPMLDAGPVDADAGVAPPDAGPPDGGIADAGTSPLDGSAADGGSADAGVAPAGDGCGCQVSEPRSTLGPAVSAGVLAAWAARATREPDDE